MVAYVVFTREKMRNRDEYERYREKARPAAAGHPLKPLAVYGKHEVLEGPAIEGAVLMSTRGGDYRLTVGQDFSIGFADRDKHEVELYLCASFTFRVIEPAAAVHVVRA